MGIVAQSSLFFKKEPKNSSLCLSFFLCPPNNIIVSGDIILHFDFFPTQDGKKLQNWSLKSESHAELCVCFGGKGGAMNRKEAETHCAALVCSQTPGVLVSLRAPAGRGGGGGGGMAGPRDKDEEELE